jgi:tetratricopeptide (TPR) repeat protein
MRGPDTLSGCELRANLAGFRSDSINLFDRKSNDNPEVGTIFLHRQANVEGLTVSVTAALAPGSARKAFDKGREAEKKGKWEDAQRQFQKAVGEYPKFAAAWYELGRTQEHLNDIEGARKSYAQSLAADAKFVSPYEQLAGLAASEKNWPEMAKNSSRLLQLNRVDFPRAWYSNAFANFQLQNIEAAEKSAREGIAADSGHHFPQMNYLLAIILEQKQDYAGAAASLRSYITLAPKAADVDKVKQQLAELERRLQPEAKKE